MRAVERRLAELERQAPRQRPPDAVGTLLRHLSFREIESLQRLQHDGPALEAAFEKLAPIAMARRTAGARIADLDQAEREAERIVRVRDPDGDPSRVFTIVVAPCPLEPDIWRPEDDWHLANYGQRWPLPRRLSTALVEQLCPYHAHDHRCKCGGQRRIAA